MFVCLYSDIHLCQSSIHSISLQFTLIIPVFPYIYTHINHTYNNNNNNKFIILSIFQSTTTDQKEKKRKYLYPLEKKKNSSHDDPKAEKERDRQKSNAKAKAKQIIQLEKQERDSQVCKSEESQQEYDPFRFGPTDRQTETERSDIQKRKKEIFSGSHTYSQYTSIHIPRIYIHIYTQTHIRAYLHTQVSLALSHLTSHHNLNFNPTHSYILLHLAITSTRGLQDTGTSTISTATETSALFIYSFITNK